MQPALQNEVETDAARPVSEPGPDLR